MTCNQGNVVLTFTVSNAGRLAGNHLGLGCAVLDQGSVTLTKE